MTDTIRIKNKRAFYEYFISDRIIAGIQLTGTEIKSIRNGKVNLTDAFCVFESSELFIKNMHIAEYAQGTYNNHEPKRSRKLLLNKKELSKLSVKTKEKGFTIVPISLFINARGLAKLEIALAKGKHTYDKRESLKQKDSKREIETSSDY